MNYSKPLTAQERKVIQPMLSQRSTNKLVNPQEKLGEKSAKTLPIRGNNYGL